MPSKMAITPVRSSAPSTVVPSEVMVPSSWKTGFFPIPGATVSICPDSRIGVPDIPPFNVPNRFPALPPIFSAVSSSFAWIPSSASFSFKRSAISRSPKLSESIRASSSNSARMRASFIWILSVSVMSESSCEKFICLSFLSVFIPYYIPGQNICEAD